MSRTCDTPHDLQCDLLIVGAGLAGSILADNLSHAGFNIRIVSDPSIPAASRVAAGLINPVTGKRLVLQQNIEALLLAAEKYYHDVEARFEVKLLHQKEMLRVFQSEQERSAWEKRRGESACHDYIDSDLYEGEASVHAPFGSFLQWRTGYLDTNALLNALHHQFRQDGRLIESAMVYDDLTLHSDVVMWREIAAKRVLFCEGWRGRSNPWFDWLPFRPVKGEILTLSCAGDIPQIPDRIINRGKWLLPTGLDQFKCGATYDRIHLDESPTEAAREELLSAMQQMLVNRPDTVVTGHAAGVRPGTKDRQPLLGFHPEHSQLGIFNGFGSKGSLLIPWYAECFTAHLLGEAAVPEEATIARFYG